MQGILRLFCKDKTNSNTSIVTNIQLKSWNVFLGPGILTPSGLESRILQPETKFLYIYIGVEWWWWGFRTTGATIPSFSFPWNAFSLHVSYLQTPRLDTIVNVLHLSPSSSENTKTVFLLLRLVSVSSFVKFMSTTQLFFFPPQFLVGPPLGIYNQPEWM